MRKFCVFLQNCEIGVVQCAAERPLECRYSSIRWKCTQCISDGNAASFVLESIDEEKVVRVNSVKTVFDSGILFRHYILLSIRFRTISQDDLNLFEIPELSDDVSNKNDENRKYPPHKCKCKCAVHHPSQQQFEQVQHAHGPPQQAFVQRQPSIVEENRDVTKMPEAIVITPASPEDNFNTNDLKNTIQKLENVSMDSRMAVLCESKPRTE